MYWVSGWRGIRTAPDPRPECTRPWRGTTCAGFSDISMSRTIWLTARMTCGAVFGPDPAGQRDTARASRVKAMPETFC